MTTQSPEDFFNQAAEDIKAAEKEHQELADIEEWKPTSPGQLRGYFMKAEWIPTKFGAAYKVFLKDFDTEVPITVFCAVKMLQRGLLDASPKAGTLMVFDYQGTQTGKSGFDYQAYYVRAAESDPELWAKLTELTPERKQRLEEKKNGGSSAPTTTSYDDPMEAPY